MSEKNLYLATFNRQLAHRKSDGTWRHGPFVSEVRLVEAEDDMEAREKIHDYFARRDSDDEYSRIADIVITSVIR